MQASAVAMALMKYSVGEVKRRGRHSSAELRSSQHKTKTKKGTAVTAPSSSAWDQPAVDLEDLVRILQRSENHLLATRVLYSSWHNGPAKSQVICCTCSASALLFVVMFVGFHVILPLN